MVDGLALGVQSRCNGCMTVYCMVYETVVSRVRTLENELILRRFIVVKEHSRQVPFPTLICLWSVSEMVRSRKIENLAALLAVVLIFLRFQRITCCV